MHTMEQKIFIIGFMGVGKTTLARQAATLFNVPFFDTDQMIEEITGLRVTQIFDQWGEKYFRRMERDVIHQLMAMRGNCIAALGGGSVCQPDILDWLNRIGLTIWLNTDWSIIEQRLSLDTTRPLVSKLSKIELDELWKARSVFYQKAQWNCRDAQEVIFKLEEYLG